MIAAASSYNAHRRGVVIKAITNHVHSTLGFRETLVSDWQAANLLKPSMLKPVFTSLQQDLILRPMGRLSRMDLSSLREVLATVWADFAFFVASTPSPLTAKDKFPALRGHSGVAGFLYLGHYQRGFLERRNAAQLSS